MRNNPTFQSLSLSVFLALICLPGLLPAQENRWSIALRTSYFGSQSRVPDAVTSIATPVSAGGSVRYRLSSGFSVQHALDYVRGDIRDRNSRETFVQSSLSFVTHLSTESAVSPYLLSGLGLILRSPEGETSVAKMKLLCGAGCDVQISSRVFFSVQFNMMTNGWTYNGWIGSTGIGVNL